MTLNMLAFQNCGKAEKGARDYSSTGLITNPLEYKEKQIIVRMKNSTANMAMTSFANGNGLQLENNWPDSNMTHWSWEGPLSVDEVRTVLAQSSMKNDIVYAEPNYLYHEAVNYSLNEIFSFPLVNQALTTVNIQQSQLWPSLTPGKAKPIIAVIDTGINTSHDVFTATGALWVNTAEIPGDGIDNDSNGYIDDINGYNFRDKNANITDLGGHGTHCAGIILGVGQNIFKQTSSLDQAKIRIMALKFIGPDGAGSTSDAINAILYAIRNGAKVISNSWGGSTNSRALEDTVKTAYDNEVVFVAAAGNSASNIDAVPIYPASLKVPNVISVAATNGADRLSDFSNFGTVSVTMAAPGESILSTYPTNSFTYLSGTSMATPFIAGTAILQLYERPGMLSYQLKNIIVQKSDSVAALNGKIMNPVRLNSYAAVQEARIATISTEHPAYKGSSVAAAQADQGGAGGCGTIAKIGGGNPPMNPPLIVVLMFILPLVAALQLRKREEFATRGLVPQASDYQRRRHFS